MFIVLYIKFLVSCSQPNGLYDDLSFHTADTSGVGYQLHVKKKAGTI